MSPPRKKLRSAVVTEGLDRAPHRAFLRATGVADEDFGKPFVGIVSQHGENTPCSMSLGPQADAARLGVAQGGGVPVRFTTISVSDGMSMNHKGMRMSLVSRELIADSIEAVVRGHAYDALVGFAGCDKTLPGVMMAMVRLDCPSVFVYGGAMLPGSWRGRDVTILTTYEGVGSVLAGDDERRPSSTSSAAPARRRSARARASSPPTRWRWSPRRSASRCRARRCCPPRTASGSRWPAVPAAAPPRSCGTAARCRASS